MTSGLDSTSICMFWSTLYPEIDNPLILLYMNWVFSAYKSSPNKQGNSWIGVSVSNGCVWRTISHELFKKFEHNLDFVPHMIYDTKAIIWHVLFITNIFEWTGTLSLLEVSVQQENFRLCGFHWWVKWRRICLFNELLNREQV